MTVPPVDGRLAAWRTEAMDIDRRRLFVIGVGALVLGAAGSAQAAETKLQPFTEAAFDAAQKAGKPILIDTFATWCQICARQAPTLEKLGSDAKYKDLVILRVNFDTQKDVMRRFHASIQSTLIAFRGTKEVGRSVGETQPEWIEDLADKAVSNSTT